MISIRLRLYRIHDYDLYILYLSKHFDFTRAVKDALFAYYNGEMANIRVTERDIVYPKNPKKLISTIITFNEHTESDIIDLIFSVEKGNRNMFIKNVVRKNLSGMENFYFDKQETKSKAPKQTIVNDHPVNKKISSEVEEKRKEKEFSIPIKKISVNKLIKSKTEEADDANIINPDTLNEEEDAESLASLADEILGGFNL